MSPLTPDLPLILRIVLMVPPLVLSAWGFATGSVAIGVVGIAASGWLFHRLFLLDAGRSEDE